MPTFEIYNMAIKSLQDSAKISLFSYLKTGNVIIDTIVSTALITCFTYIANLIYSSENIKIFDISEFFISFLLKKNTIIFEGKRSSALTYNSQLSNSSSFTDSFKAIFYEIISNIDNNDTIHEIKEFFMKDECDMNSKCYANFDGYVISQSKRFVYNKKLKIYARTEITKQEIAGEKSKNSTMVDIIVVQLYSYVTPLSIMQKHIQQITDAYLDNVENSRTNRQFIYTLCKTKYEENRFECWKEYDFETTRTFDNIFFENKKEILNKIHFFLKNRCFLLRKSHHKRFVLLIQASWNQYW
jgi:hypothetical protein